MEIAIATAIIGLSMAALLMTVGSGTAVNSNGQQLTQATFLAQEIREWTMKLPFSDPDTAQASNPPGPDSGETIADDLDDLKSITFKPPRDASGAAISELSNWSQEITITWRNPDNLTEVLAEGASDVVDVNVVIYYGSKPVLTTSWLAVKK